MNKQNAAPHKTIGAAFLTIKITALRSETHTNDTN